MNDRKTSRLPLVALFTSLLLGSFVPQTAAQDEARRKPEQLTATAFGQAAVFAGKSVSLNIYISDYSSDDEARQLAATLQDKGSDALLNAIQRMKEKGRVAVTGYTGWSIPVVRQHRTEKGRRIVMFSDRPIGFLEARDAPRSKDYEFGLLILELNEKGEGEGACCMSPPRSGSTKTTSLKLNISGKRRPGWRP